MKNKVIVVNRQLIKQQILSETHKETNRQLETCVSANGVN